MTRNPFVGLRAFEPDEGDLFFGRRKDLRVLQNLVSTLPVLVLYAQSGTGKSSLVNAGLAPWADADVEHVSVLISDPEENVDAVVRQVLVAAGWTNAASTAGLDLASTLEKHHADTEMRAIVVLDQFEQRAKRMSNLNDLYRQIAILANVRSDAACFVISIREDYIAVLEPLMGLMNGLMDMSYRVPALSRDGLTAAVRGPLQHVESSATVEPGLIDLVLADLEQQTMINTDRSHRIEAGYFQIVWSKLWELSDYGSLALTQDMYVGAGRAQKILSDFVTAVIDALLPFEAAVLHAMIRYLVLPTGAKVALTVEDVCGLVGEQDLPQVFVAALEGARQGVPQDGSIATQAELERAGSCLKPTFINFESVIEYNVSSVFKQLTRTESPLFRRVVRGSRVEYELVHDLLGPILVAWRSDHNSSPFPARQEDLLAYKEADDKPESTQHGGKRLTRALEQLQNLNRAFEDVHRGPEKVVAVAQDVVAVASVLRKSMRGVVPPAILELRRSVALENISLLSDLIVRAVSTEDEPRTARAFDQGLVLILVASRIDFLLLVPGSAPVRNASYYFRGAALSASALAFGVGGVLGVDWILNLLVPLPAISYKALTLGIFCVGAVFCYALGLSEGSDDRITSRITKAFWPLIKNRGADGRMETKRASFLAWWPIVLVLQVTGSYLGAALFAVFGLAPTAGFNLFGLVASALCAALYLIAINF